MIFMENKPRRFIDLCLEGLESVANLPIWEAAWSIHPEDGGVDSLTYISLGHWLGFKDNHQWIDFRDGKLTLHDIRKSKIKSLG